MVKYKQELLVSQGQNQSFQSKLKQLAYIFLTHREMAEFEALYRILPSLHLTESDSKCTFVPTGFPKNISKLLNKVKEDKVSAVPADEVINVENVKGTYTVAKTIHDKYASRPASLEEISLAEFAMYFESKFDNSIKKKKYENNSYGMTDRKITSAQGQESFLPEAIKLQGRARG